MSQFQENSQIEEYEELIRDVYHNEGATSHIDYPEIKETVLLCMEVGKEKANQCLNREFNPESTKSWPQQGSLNELMEKIGALNGAKAKEDYEEWLSQKSQAFWELCTKDISKENQSRILREYTITHIAQEITNIIKLEEYYLGLKNLGEFQWENSDEELKELASDETLLRMSENPEYFIKEDGEKRKIPDWIRGVILTLAMLGSKQGQYLIAPQTKRLPDAPMLKTATIWALGNHLLIKNKPLRIEESIVKYQEMRKYRKKVKLRLKFLEFQNIAKEIDVPDPASIKEEEIETEIPENRKTYKWLLCWNFIPNTEREIRTIANKWIDAHGGQEAIESHFKMILLRRWIQSITRREFLRILLSKGSIRERMLIKKTVLKPTNSFLNSSIAPHNKLLYSIILTDCIWRREMDRLKLVNS